MVFIFNSLWYSVSTRAFANAITLLICWYFNEKCNRYSFIFNIDCVFHHLRPFCYITFFYVYGVKHSKFNWILNDKLLVNNSTKKKGSSHLVSLSIRIRVHFPIFSPYTSPMLFFFFALVYMFVLNHKLPEFDLEISEQFPIDFFSRA